MKLRSLWLACAMLLGAVGAASACPNVPTINLATDGNGNGCVTTTPGLTTAVAQIGPAMIPFAATTGDQALTLTLPGKVRLQDPGYLIGTSTGNPTPLQVNYSGGNACTAPTETLGPGQIGDWVYIANTTQPHVCLPSGAASFLIEGQQ
jgi:hypothetical protein